MSATLVTVRCPNNPKFNIIGKSKGGDEHEVGSNKEISKESDKIFLLQSFILFSKNPRQTQRQNKPIHR